MTDGLELQISELQAAHASLMVSNEELVKRHQRHLGESQAREERLIQELELSRSALKKHDVELRACKDVIDAANETIVLKVRRRVVSCCAVNCRLQTHTRVRTCTRTHTHTHARTPVVGLSAFLLVPCSQNNKEKQQTFVSQMTQTASYSLVSGSSDRAS